MRGPQRRLWGEAQKALKPEPVRRSPLALAPENRASGLTASIRTDDAKAAERLGDTLLTGAWNFGTRVIKRSDP